MRLRDVAFRYPSERFQIRLDRLDLPATASTGVIGPSGCGKTTLLRLIAGILSPAAGSVRVMGTELATLSELERRRFRIRQLGLVFQEFELLDYLTALENILLPYRVTSELELDPEAIERARQLANTTGIEHVLDDYPAAMSQGERQRVAICRALVTQPRLILADEPTGSLDPDNQRRVVSLLQSTTAELGAGLVMVTHDHELLGEFDRVVDLVELAGGAAR